MSSVTRRGLRALTLGLLAAVGAGAQEPPSIAPAIGFFDTAAWLDDEGDFEAVEAGVQLRGASDWLWGLGPIGGVSATDEGSFWVYTGLRRPFRLGARWVVSPSLAVAWYERGDGKDLGQDLEFRSGIELVRRLAGGSTVGFEYTHLSNASLSDVNPGSNSLVFVWAFRLGR